jgi:pimeloyl-ACP methyl ester carboxylesterase
MLGCGTQAIMSMPSEESIPLLAATQHSADRYENHTSYIPTALSHSTQDRYEIAIHETGNLEAEHTLVMIHGVFTDHSSWRYVRGELVDTYRLWLIDLPGCGDSQSPPFDDHAGHYSPNALAERVLQAIDSQLAHTDAPQRVTLVGHSLAGQVILRAIADPAFQEQHARTLSRIEGVVLLAPLDISEYTPHSVFTDIIRLTNGMVELTWNVGLLELKIAHATRNSFPDPDLAPREEALKRLEILRDPIKRQSMQAMLRQAIPLVNGVLNRQEVDRLEAHYQNIDVPLLILWGTQDRILPVRMGHKLARQLPGAELIIFDYSKHSIHQDSPSLCASIIDSFVQTRLAPIVDSDQIRLAVEKRTDRSRQRITPASIQTLLGR